MKKRIISLVIILAMVIGILPTTVLASTGFLDGDGTETSPYLISNKNHLNNVRNYPKAHFKLMCDIEFSPVDFDEVGAFYNNGQGFEPIDNFRGTFDGNGYAIKNLYINKYSENDSVYVGLFSFNEGTVRNLGMIDCNISATSKRDSAYAGAIAGHNHYLSEIENCYNTGSVSAFSIDSAVGGIVGHADESTVSLCYNTGSISGDKNVGGIVGYNRGGNITKCFNTGDVTASDSDYSLAWYAGGITGYNPDGTVFDCYNKGNIVSKNTKITEFVNHITNAGGIVGYDFDGTIFNCYNTGYVSADETGGILGGFNDEQIVETVVDNCYYINTLASVFGTSCSIEQMKRQSTFIGFDFENVWDFDLSLDTHFTPVIRNLGHVEKKENTTDFSGGIGTIDNPYLISNKTQLNNIRNFFGSHFKLINDIEFTEEDFVKGGAFYNDGKGFEPIGSSPSDAFTGVFDGNNFTIKNLYIKITATDADVYAGLFGYNKGVIKNLGIVDCDISANSDETARYLYAGSIAGYNKGEITDCYNTGNVIASAKKDDNNILSENYNTHAGGIAGESYFESDITNCLNSGKINSYSETGDAYVGGISGVGGEITNCRNTGEVEATSYSENAYSGGMSGYGATISNCSNTASVLSVSKSYNAYSGGIIAYSLGVIERSYNTGAVTALTNAFSGYMIYATAGGISGYSDIGRITNCYNAGEILAKYSGSNSGSGMPSAYKAGISGYNNGATITKCYNVGAVKPESSYASSGIVSMNYGLVTNCYYLDTALKGIGQSFGTSDESVKCTAEQMKLESTFSGFNFVSEWTLELANEYLYPQLISNIQQQIKSVSIVTQPYKNTFIEGLIPNLDGATAKVVFEGDVEKIISIKEKMLVGLDIYTVSQQKLRVKIANALSDDTINLECVEKSIESIDVYTSPSKLVYVQKQPVDPNGATVLIEYDNGTTEYAALEDVTFEYDTTKLGTVPVTASYKGFTDTFDITVNKRVLDYILIKEPEKSTYHVGEEIDVTGGLVYTVFVSDDNYSESVPFEISMISGYDKQKTGYQTVTVTYQENRKTFLVNVYPHEYQSEFDEYNHFDKCGICGDAVNLIEHTFENDCDPACDCGFERAITHNYNLAFEGEVHFDRCTVCGDTVNVAPHNFDGGDYDKDCICGFEREIPHDYVNMYDEYGHFEKCTICGDVINFAEHVYENDCDMYCDCGSVREVSHNYQSNFDKNGHYEECTLCGHEINYQQHIFDTNCDSDCECGFIRKVEHDYKSEFDTKLHFDKCSVCGDVINVKAHEFENECDSTCDCGYKRRVTHYYKTNYNANEHFEECMVCGDKRNVTEHTFKNACDEDCSCGFERKLIHNYQPEFRKGSHFEECTVCGDKKNVEPHNFENSCDADCDCGFIRKVEHDYKSDFDEKLHYEECTVCGDKKNVEPHNFENSCDTDCDCGFIRKTEHTFRDYVYNGDATYEKDGTKTRTCSGCGHSETVVAEGTKLEKPALNGWQYEGGWVYYENGVKVKNTWKLDSTGWCYLGSNGIMATNKWIMDSVGWCYVGANGYCITNSWMADSVGWCYLDKDGRMVVNDWVADSQGLCWLDSSGYWDGVYH